MKILYFAPIDWEFIRQRPQHLAQGLAKYFDFVYVQPFGLRNLKPSDFNRALKRFFAFFKKQSSDDGLIIKNLIFLPMINHSINRFNQRILKKQIRPLTDNNTIIWVTSPSKLIPHLLEELKFKVLIYEMMDKYAEIHTSAKRDIAETEMYLAKKASLIITTSKALLKEAKMLNERTVLIGNGVDYDFFNEADFTKPGDLDGMQRIVGYAGSIDKWIDFETINYLAESRMDLDFVFVGPVKIRNVPVRDNIHFLGQKNYATLPGYYNHFDVCMIPFTPGMLSDTINPVKLYEYFALGKPVVAYRAEELTSFGELIYLATHKLDFLEKLAEALAEKDPDVRLKRKEVAKLNDWSVKTGLLKDALAEL